MLAAQHSYGNPALLGLHQQQQDHMAKQEEEAMLQQQPSGPWSSDDYEHMMRNLFGGASSQSLFPDIDAPASLGSFSTSHAGSYMSGSSDNGASPSSLNDFVYGAQNFPTPPESDMSIASRHMSVSMHPSNGFSPSNSLDFQQSAAYRPSFAGSDTTSPYNQAASLPGPSGTSPFSTQQISHHPLSGIHPNDAGAANSYNSLQDFARSNSTQWNPNFLMPDVNMSAAADMQALQPRFGSEQGMQNLFQPELPQASSTAPLPAQPVSPASKVNRKRSMADVNGSATADVKSARRPSAKVSAKAAAVAAAAPASSVAANTTAGSAAPPSIQLPGELERQTKKLKSAPLVRGRQVEASQSIPLKPISSKLPHMEVGSNATALAAIERLKAKRLQEREEAAKAAAMKKASSDSTPSPSRSDGSDKPVLTPSMRQQKKVAHNAIERRYRNNINDRIAALRRAVPALREIRPRKTPSGRKSRKAQQEEDLVDGVPAATKLNKATILGKATDYIKYLKSRELRLTSEVAGLRELVRSLEGGEELLELWEGEMEKVVAEQEAAAAAAAAKEDEEAEGMDAGMGGDDLDEDDDDEEEEHDGDTSQNSSSSASPPSQRGPRSSQARGGRGSLSAVASSRYMLATFLGISFIGGGAEFAIDSTASDASRAVARPSTGKVVVGASRQLLKRSAAYLGPSTAIAEEVHHYDDVPSHVLAFEILRVVSFAVCFLFLVWPLLSPMRNYLGMGRRPLSSSVPAETQEREAHIGRKKRLVALLEKPNVTAQEADLALRNYIRAPSSFLAALPALAKEICRAGLARAPVLQRLLPSANLLDDATAVEIHLLEVETMTTDLAQGSYLLRLHTALKLANDGLSKARSTGVVTSNSSTMKQARLLGTLAIAFARLGDGVDFMQDAADQYWAKARSVLLSESQRDDEDTNAIVQHLKNSKDASWLSEVLCLDLDTALELLPSASEHVSGYKQSPLLSIADAHYSAQLQRVWNSLLCSLVRSSCPSSPAIASSTLLKGFVSHQSTQKLNLDVVTNIAKRDQLHAQITLLARTAPPSTPSWAIAQVTLATWSAVLGNLALARHVASTLVESSSPQVAEIACVAALHRFLSTGAPAKQISTPARGSLDGTATLFISWLHFLRMFASPVTTAADISTATLNVRRLISAATRSSDIPANIVSSNDDDQDRTDDIEEAADILTDLCIAIGRRTAHFTSLPQNAEESSPPAKFLLESSEGEDSGVEF